MEQNTMQHNSDKEQSSNALYPNELQHQCANNQQCKWVSKDA